MTNARQVMAMIRSHAAGDNERFLSLAEQIAADATKSGKTKVAEEIQGLVDGLRRQTTASVLAKPVPLASPRGDLIGLVRASYPEIYLSDLVLNADLDRLINRVVREHRERFALEERGLEPRRKFLFSGPPGTGKSMTAAAIAGSLSLPLFTILLDGVITKFMGETASKLRLVFDAMHSARGVYLFDEVDALATRRGAENDIGEARRMLNSFLQFLEEDRSQSIIIAATNHRELLDRAIFRRFDSAFLYARPSAEEARQVLVNQLVAFDISALDWADAIAAADGLSQADLVAAAADAARDAVLDGDGDFSTASLVRALRDRTAIHSS